jgi:hypothetical protein
MAPSRPRRRLTMLALLAVVLGLGALVGLTVPIVAAELEAPSEVATCTPLAENGAAGVEGLVPIQSLAQGNVYDHGPPTSILLVSAKPDPIVPVIDPAEAPTIAAVDLGTDALVALFIGRWPQAGHRVTIQSVRVTENGVCLTALLVGPSPGQDASDAETYPYHVVSVPLAALPQDPGTTWTVVSADGARIASTTFP